MITNKWFKGEENITEIIKLRRKIFGVEGKDEYDKFSFNLGIYENGEKLVGIGRLAVKEDKFFIDYIGVDERYRRKYYGDFILRVLIKKAFDLGLNKIYIESSREFGEYLKRLNFEFEKDVNKKVLLSWKGDLPNGCCN